MKLCVDHSAKRKNPFGEVSQLRKDIRIEADKNTSFGSIGIYALTPESTNQSGNPKPSKCLGPTTTCGQCKKISLTASCSFCVELLCGNCGIRCERCGLKFCSMCIIIKYDDLSSDSILCLSCKD
ncbi:hypothetical protein K493DRAFT_320181 [Basidiobolus meristosporus CBS 931.73]|uniref:Uncharacterized protein n=1 Tax=Basidiobolus meristosporus CBS 931.73 TaxID=1314790 RepID=A0A1Y1WXR2_9FUNG|nr:hypothetical protein K493DRAFT_321235 [Basidiobolus meristosporus CBS 931.73]ORX83959.1 hypothetical protein K493DRAFT_320181 [Basidiobolus meristosporus CBS 931.73]|eukprot:ORX78341.1 hypothetical protein K493DRAFT_321235 [Basidiobolus meristosporus CBS 931.73]